MGLANLHGLNSSSGLLSLAWKSPEHETPHGGHLAPLHSFLRPASALSPGAALLSQPLSPQCPPNLHKLDGYYCDHEQV